MSKSLYDRILRFIERYGYRYEEFVVDAGLNMSNPYYEFPATIWYKLDLVYLEWLGTEYREAFHTKTWKRKFLELTK